MATTLTTEDIQAIAVEVYGLIISGQGNSIDYDASGHMDPPQTDEERARYFLGVIQDLDGENETAGNMSLQDLLASFGAECVELNEESAEKLEDLSEINENVNTKAESIEDWKTAAETAKSEAVKAKGKAEEARDAALESQAAAEASKAAAVSSAASAGNDSSAAAQSLSQMQQLKAQMDTNLALMQGIVQKQVVAPITIEGKLMGWSIATRGGEVWFELSEIETTDTSTDEGET